MIALADVRKTYQMGAVSVRALDGVSLRIDRGEFVAIVGPSGSGKSTLMHILGLLDTPDGGSYRLDGRLVSRLGEDELAELRARTVGFVFQQFNLLPRVSARGNVALPLIYADHAARQSPDLLLERVGLADRRNHAPNELSGGQQQRVAIARALVNAPDIIMADEPTGNLDSKSAADIMGILRELHAAGLTVIIVTHDPQVAANADRVITMLDGGIVSDTVRRAGAADSAPAPAPVAPVAWRPLRKLGAMLRQAGRALWANKTRTFLSMLGVLIGVGAVIDVMALGAGARKAVEERISSMGANLLILRRARGPSEGISLGAGAVSRLTLDDAAAIGSSISGVTAVSPIVRGPVQVTAEGANWRTTLIGAEPDYAAMHAMTPAVGRFFSADEVLARKRVAVIGLTVVQELFGTLNPIGRTIRINRVGFEVIGLLPEKGASFHMNENDQVIVPVTTAMRRLLGKDFVDSIEIQAATADDIDYVEVAAPALAARRHRLGSDTAFEIRNLADIQNTIASTNATITALLLGIGAISLLVGGIGIMNIMLVSVAERTREIGLRKAVGARRGDILTQFLVEALVVSMCGGLVGILVGVTASLIMARVSGWAVEVTAQTVGVAFAFSAIIGVVFGLWPARKAAALAPIEALRYE